MNSDFWQIQTREKPLFPDVLWSKPEARNSAGKLTIIGGNSRGFSSVAASFETARKVGAGEIKIVLPDVLKKKISENFAKKNDEFSRNSLQNLKDLKNDFVKNSVNSAQKFSNNSTDFARNFSDNFSLRNNFSNNFNNNFSNNFSNNFANFARNFNFDFSNFIFAPSNPSGGFSRDALGDFRAAENFSDAILFVGDSGANSETASLLEKFLLENTENLQEKSRKIPKILTRDAVDLTYNFAENLLQNAEIHLVLSLAQMQKMFRKIYYPRVITFSQGARQIAETLHKFTLSYPAKITLWHAGNLFFAGGGKVISEKFAEENFAMRVWSGEIATRAAVWQMWQESAEKAVAASWAEI